MIKKQTFVSMIDAIQKQREMENRVSKSLEEVLDGNFVPTFSGILETQIIKILEEAMCDVKADDGQGWIEWWIYEKDFGKRKKINANYTNGKKIKLDTSADLYNFLKKECK